MHNGPEESQCLLSKLKNYPYIIFLNIAFVTRVGADRSELFYQLGLQREALNMMHEIN